VKRTIRLLEDVGREHGLQRCRGCHITTIGEVIGDAVKAMRAAEKMRLAIAAWADTECLNDTEPERLVKALESYERATRREKDRSKP